MQMHIYFFICFIIGIFLGLFCRLSIYSGIAFVHQHSTGILKLTSYYRMSCNKTEVLLNIGPYPSQEINITILNINFSIDLGLYIFSLFLTNNASKLVSKYVYDC